MSDIDPAHVIHTQIWREDAEPDNPFATRAAYCRGYDVFGQMVGRTRWVEMLYLLFRDELPDVRVLDALEALAVALANPGPRDPSIHAAMCAGVGGSTVAASLIAALSVGAGRYHGARDVFDAMLAWEANGTDLEALVAHLRRDSSDEIDIWPPREHPPGFEPHGVSTPTIVRQLLDTLSTIYPSGTLLWLAQHREAFETRIELPLDISGVAAAALHDFGFAAAEGEMLYLLLRLPGAAAHALEQTGLGYRKFPFGPISLENDPLRTEAA